MPPPTAHTPSAADLGGPVIVPVTLVTVPLSNNGAKTAAKPSGTCPITLPSCRASPLLPLCSKGYGLLSHKNVFCRSTSSKNMVTFHTAASQTG